MTVIFYRGNYSFPTKKYEIVENPLFLEQTKYPNKLLFAKYV